MPPRFATAFVAALFSVYLSGGAEAGQAVVAQTLTNPALSHLAAGAQSAGPVRPFSNLFQPSIAPTPPNPAAPGITAPRVACGMTLVPVDPKFDAAIRKPAPTRPKPAARTVVTPKCQN